MCVFIASGLPSYVHFFPEDHSSSIEAVISYNSDTHQFVSSGIDCDKQVTYQLSETDKEFLGKTVNQRIGKDHTYLTFLNPEHTSEISLAHLKVGTYHFFLVFKRDNYSMIQLQMKDIITYFERQVAENLNREHDALLYNFKVNQSVYSEMCDNCKAQGVCAPKYLNSIFTAISQ